ncbi:hypothetical protein CEXT_595701 [Caerostris extrusa]|uniref:Uncharacterized protein n=1 Tax=Caerostris extrusa TaxID=172846 RepID=A0AAV4Y2E7_CAEEX|nr:hypothetical protein CEXT_595701 [Caerostris extrusa]
MYECLESLEYLVGVKDFFTFRTKATTPGNHPENSLSLELFIAYYMDYESHDKHETHTHLAEVRNLFTSGSKHLPRRRCKRALKTEEAEGAIACGGAIKSEFERKNAFRAPPVNGARARELRNMSLLSAVIQCVDGCRRFR